MSLLGRLFGQKDSDGPAPRPRRGEVFGAKVLVASLDDRFNDLLATDLAAYQDFYPATRSATFNDVRELVTALEDGFDILHLFCDLDPTGEIGGGRTTGADLIVSCCNWDVKLLWIANDNSSEVYIKGFKLVGDSINLVMTIARKGDTHAKFLRRLLAKMTAGETMPVAWAALSPQIPGLEHPDSPDAIFAAGRGDVRLR